MKRNWRNRLMITIILLQLLLLQLPFQFVMTTFIVIFFHPLQNHSRATAFPNPLQLFGWYWDSSTTNDVISSLFFKFLGWQSVTVFVHLLSIMRLVWPSKHSLFLIVIRTSSATACSIYQCCWLPISPNDSEHFLSVCLSTILSVLSSSLLKC